MGRDHGVRSERRTVAADDHDGAVRTAAHLEAMRQALTEVLTDLGEDRDAPCVPLAEPARLPRRVDGELGRVGARRQVTLDGVVQHGAGEIGGLLGRQGGAEAGLHASGQRTLGEDQGQGSEQVGHGAEDTS